MAEVRGPENFSHTFFSKSSLSPAVNISCTMRDSAISELIQYKKGLIHSNGMSVTSHLHLDMSHKNVPLPNTVDY